MANRSSERQHYLVYLLLAFFLYLLIPPFFFHSPKAGLDASWIIAIHMAVKNGLIFGKEFVFTYGPLGILNDRLPIGVSLIVYLLFDLYFLCTAFSVLKKILKDHLNIGSIFFILLSIAIFQPYTPDIWYFFFFLFFFFSFLRQPSRWTYIVQAALFSLLCFFYKVNLGIIAIFIFAGGLTYAVIKKRLTLSKYAILLCGYILAIWLAAQGLHVSLKGYISGSLHIINAYNDAMSTPLTSARYIYIALSIFLILALLILLVVIRSIRKRTLFADLDILFVCGATALSAFILFKSAFVRADEGHLIVFFNGVALFAALLYLFIPGKKAFSRIIGAGCWLVLIASAWAVNTIPEIFHPLPRITHLILLREKTREIGNYLSGLKNYNKALAHSDSLALQPNELRSIIGDHTADIVPAEISRIYFNGLHYNPRPIVQSYCAFDRYLDSLNYEKYMSADAPEYILFSYASIDERYPLFDESRTRQALLSRYVLAARTSQELILKKSPDKLELAPSRPNDTIYTRVNTDIPVPAGNDLQYARIFVNYSRSGKLIRLFYQPPPLKIIFTLENGEIRTFNAIKPILASGVLLNKYVENDDEFQLLMQSGGALNTNVRTIRLEAPIGFKPEVSIVNSYYSLKGKSASRLLSDSLGIARLRSSYTQYKPRPIDSSKLQPESFKFNVDKIAFESPFTQFEATGWAYRENADNTAYTTRIIFRSSDTTYEIPTHAVYRPGLSTYFKRPDLDSIGFAAILGKDLIPPGLYQIGIMIADKKGNGAWVNYDMNERVLVSGHHSPDLFKTNPATSGNDRVEYVIQSMEQKSNGTLIVGWAYVKNADSRDWTTNLLLQNGENTYRIKTDNILRKDVAAVFKDARLSHCGFSVMVPFNELPKGKYSIWIEKASLTGKDRLAISSDSTLSIHP